ncbi:endo-1,3 [Cucumis melo var. makuwa]|uniref:Endo-1,3 n=1 Tax=Cucumis melo var. makuwa TaxID=1194695 RepID=A0A5A7U1E1_CUCMM|nr:endo-1,3 [Cucumis melo var. makuwa]TYJ98649.1 endo-1,3 [Cucumis melo var. makuwa]
MNAAKSMDENLDEFKRLTFEINQTKEKLEKESKVTILLNYLPDTYKDVKGQRSHKRKPPFKCYHCHKEGHIKRNISDRKKKDFKDHYRSKEHGKVDFSIGEVTFAYSKTLAATHEKAMNDTEENED